MSDNIAIGSRVEITANGVLTPGTVRFCGTTSFATGKWVGIELDQANGKNDGSVQGIRYFDCEPACGVFVRSSQIKAILSSPIAATAPNSADVEVQSEHGSSVRSLSPPTSVKSVSTTVSTTGKQSGVPSSPSLKVSTLKSATAKTGTSTRSPATAKPATSTSGSSPLQSASSAIKRTSAASTTSSPASTIRKAKSPLGSGNLSKVQDKEKLSPSVSSPVSSSSTQSPLAKVSSSPVNTPVSNAVEDDTIEAETPPVLIETPPNEMVTSTKHEATYSSSPLSSTSFQLVDSSPIVETPEIEVARETVVSVVATRPVMLDVEIQAEVNEDMAELRAAHMNAMKELEDLKIKLRISENKRAESRDYESELRKLKEELDTLNITKTSMTTKLNELQAELKEQRRVAHEATSEKESFENQLLDVSEQLELLTLDKEVAEEKAESMEMEMLSLQEKLEELELELEVAKQERDERPVAESASEQPTSKGGELSDSDRSQYEQQINRLKSALVRLRDVSADQEAEMKSKLEQLQRELSQSGENSGTTKELVLSSVSLFVLIVSSAEINRLREKLAKAESQIEELKATVDSALGAEEMIEYLSEKNGKLNERVEELQKHVEDLEALKELNDELEENHVLTEKELEAEIEMKESIMQRMKDRFNRQEETISDYERTIHQFRELVKSLRSDLTEIESSRTASELSSEAKESQKKALAEMESQMPMQLVKTHSKAVDVELRKLETLQATEHLNIVLNYLPEAFMRDEHDSISCLLLLRRLIFKANMIKTLIGEFDVQSQTPASLSFNGESRQQLTVVESLCLRLTAYMETCSPENFGQIGKAYHDLIGTERRMQTLVEAIKIDEWKGVQVAQDLQRCIGHLEHLVDVYAKKHAQKTFSQGWAVSYADYLSVTIDRLELEVSNLEQCFESGESHEEVKLTILRKLIGHVSTHIREQRENGKAISLPILSQLSFNASEALLSVREDAPGVGLHNALLSQSSALHELLEKLEGSVNVESATAASPPWIARSEALKQEYSVNTEMAKQIENLNEEVMLLLAEVNTKRQLQQETSVKIDLLEKKLEGSRQQAEKISSLELRVQKLMEKERQYSEAVEHLKEENDKLELEVSQLKKLSRRPEKFGPMSPRQARRSYQSDLDRSPNSASPGKGSAALLAAHSDGMDLQESLELLMDGNIAAQFESLKAALRYLRAENTRLKSQRILNASKDIFASNDPLMKRSSHSTVKDLERPLLPETSPGSSITFSTSSSLAEVIKESKSLAQDVIALSVDSKVVDVTKSSELSAKWSSINSDPMFQFKNQSEIVSRLVHRGEDLSQRVKQIANKIDHHTAGNTTPLSNAEKPLLARIRLPAHAGRASTIGSLASKTSMVLTSRAQWEQIHTVFAT
ncbi:hypothetical protein HDU76_000098 [Blyttiomyces sp. JEL0837]|nr:hypothetical protein HDU76_000098 [Blyttiomyces sp. JEL0837]